MRSHIQGVFVLLFVGIALMGLARYAAPVLSEAFGDEGAIIAKSAEPEDPANAPLTGEEVIELQTNLTALGFDPGPVDGILGSITKAAIAAAINQYELAEESSHRAVLVHTVSLNDAALTAETETTTLGE